MRFRYYFVVVLIALGLLTTFAQPSFADEPCVTTDEYGSVAADIPGIRMAIVHNRFDTTGIVYDEYTQSDGDRIQVRTYPGCVVVGDDRRWYMIQYRNPAGDGGYFRAQSIVGYWKPL